MVANQTFGYNPANRNSYHIAPDRPMLRGLGRSASGRLSGKCPKEWFMVLVALWRRCFVATVLKPDAKGKCKTIKGRAACSQASCPPTSTSCLIIGDKADAADRAPKKDSLPIILRFLPPVLTLRGRNECFQALTASNVRHVTPRLGLKRLTTLILFLFQASSGAGDF